MSTFTIDFAVFNNWAAKQKGRVTAPVLCPGCRAERDLSLACPECNARPLSDNRSFIKIVLLILGAVFTFVMVALVFVYAAPAFGSVGSQTVRIGIIILALTFLAYLWKSFRRDLQTAASSSTSRHQLLTMAKDFPFTEKEDARIRTRYFIEALASPWQPDHLRHGKVYDAFSHWRYTVFNHGQDPMNEVLRDLLFASCLLNAFYSPRSEYSNSMYWPYQLAVADVACDSEAILELAAAIRAMDTSDKITELSMLHHLAVLVGKRAPRTQAALLRGTQVLDRYGNLKSLPPDVDTTGSRDARLSADMVTAINILTEDVKFIRFVEATNRAWSGNLFHLFLLEANREELKARIVDVVLNPRKYVKRDKALVRIMEAVVSTECEEDEFLAGLETKAMSSVPRHFWTNKAFYTSPDDNPASASRISWDDMAYASMTQAFVVLVPKDGEPISILTLGSEVRNLYLMLEWMRTVG